jgi:hypothetical protein
MALVHVIEYGFTNLLNVRICFCGPARCLKCKYCAFNYIDLHVNASMMSIKENTSFTGSFSLIYCHMYACTLFVCALVLDSILSLLSV